MDVTEVRIKVNERANDKLRAFCSITFDDCFVVRDIKIIEGDDGLFIAMPSRKISTRCNACRSKNHLRARFCSDCGKKLPPDSDNAGRQKLHADIAHPISAECRNMIQDTIIQAYHDQTADSARQPSEAPVESVTTD